MSNLKQGRKKPVLTLSSFMEKNSALAETRQKTSLLDQALSVSSSSLYSSLSSSLSSSTASSSSSSSSSTSFPSYSDSSFSSSTASSSEASSTRLSSSSSTLMALLSSSSPSLKRSTKNIATTDSKDETKSLFVIPRPSGLVALSSHNYEAQSSSLCMVPRISTISETLLHDMILTRGSQIISDSMTNEDVKKFYVDDMCLLLNIIRRLDQQNRLLQQVHSNSNEQLASFYSVVNSILSKAEHLDSTLNEKSRAIKSFDSDDEKEDTKNNDVDTDVEQKGQDTLETPQGRKHSSTPSSIPPSTPSSTLPSTQEMVKLVAKNTYSLTIHRQVFINASPVFKAMMSHKMAERETKQVVFEHLTEISLKLLVLYLYTAQIHTRQCIKNTMTKTSFETDDVYDLYCTCGIKNLHFQVFLQLYQFAATHELERLCYLCLLAFKNSLKSIAPTSENKTVLCRIVIQDSLYLWSEKLVVNEVYRTHVTQISKEVKTNLLQIFGHCIRRMNQEEQNKIQLVARYKKSIANNNGPEAIIASWVELIQQEGDLEPYHEKENVLTCQIRRFVIEIAEQLTKKRGHFSIFRWIEEIIRKELTKPMKKRMLAAHYNGLVMFRQMVVEHSSRSINKANYVPSKENLSTMSEYMVAQLIAQDSLNVKFEHLVIEMLCNWAESRSVTGRNEAESDKKEQVTNDENDSIMSELLLFIRFHHLRADLYMNQIKQLKTFLASKGWTKSLCVLDQILIFITSYYWTSKEQRKNISWDLRLVKTRFSRLIRTGLEPPRLFLEFETCKIFSNADRDDFVSIMYNQ